MIIKPVGDKQPQIAATAKIAETAALIGDVILEDGANIWYGAVLRGDIGRIVIGKNSNVQENASLHTETGGAIVLGENVTVGHGAILHGCTVGDGALIGMGAIVLDGAEIGVGALVGAGALVTGGTVVPPGTLCLGSPARVRRERTGDELAASLDNAQEYVHAAQEQL
ncbi:MAG: gamma carbonic anhydrase family protein [Oscillospiraceae bacterium]|jgi:carbonic anhydrase/acetyltransferase-like protein (isoleucine patch superfamily)|nr:gamma carbonic anhydrase family protein [Oscillospiraceae bacterium]